MPILDPVVGVDGTGDKHQTAGFLADPPLEQVDPRVASGRIGIQIEPIGIEGHDRVVLRQFLHRGRKMIQNRMRVLRNRSVGRLQNHIHDRIVIAAQLIAEKLVLARRTARQEQHAILAIDDFHVGVAHQVGGLLLRIAIAGRELDPQLDRAPPRLLDPGELEFDSLFLAVGGEDDRLSALDAPSSPDASG